VLPNGLSWISSGRQATYQAFLINIVTTPYHLLDPIYNKQKYWSIDKQYIF